MLKPAVSMAFSTCGMSAMRDATVSSTLLVSSSEVPGGVVTLTMIVPWSSSGTRPVLVEFISRTSAAMAMAKVDHISHLCLMKSITPCLYLFTSVEKIVLKALRKRAAKLSFISPFSSR